MSPSRRLRGPAGAVALATVLVAGAPAVAGAATTNTQSSSASTITLGKGFRKDLRSARVTLKAVKPAKLKGSKLTLPVTKTTTSGTLTLTHSGALTLKKGKRSVKLSAWQTVAGKSVRVSAKVGKKRRTVFTITGGKVVKDATKRTVTVSGGTVKLTSAAAKDLRTTLKAKGITGGTVGKVGVKAEPKTPVAPAPAPATPALPTAPMAPAPTPTTPARPVATPCPSPLPSRVNLAERIGDVTWTLRPSWVQYLTRLGGCVVGEGGAEATANAQATPKLAITGYTEEQGVTRIVTRGTISFIQPAHFIDIRITDAEFVLNADGSGYVVADGQGSGERGDAMAGDPKPETFEDKRLFTFDRTGVTGDETITGRTLENVTLKVAAEGAQYLSYGEGEEYGQISLNLPTALRSGSSLWKIDSEYAKAFTNGNAFAGSEGATGDNNAGFSYPFSTGWYNGAIRKGSFSFTGKVCGGYVIGSRGPVAGACPKDVRDNVFHQIQLSLSNPAIEIDGDTGTLTADVFGRGGASAATGGAAPEGYPTDVNGRIPFATLDLAGLAPAIDGSTATWRDVPVKLTAEGAKAYYQQQRPAEAGTQIDPITFSAAIGE